MRQVCGHSVIVNFNQLHVAWVAGREVANDRLVIPVFGSH